MIGQNKQIGREWTIFDNLFASIFILNHYQIIMGLKWPLTQLTTFSFKIIWKLHRLSQCIEIFYEIMVGFAFFKNVSKNFQKWTQ